MDNPFAPPRARIEALPEGATASGRSTLELGERDAFDSPWILRHVLAGLLALLGWLAVSVLTNVYLTGHPAGWPGVAVFTLAWLVCLGPQGTPPGEPFAEDAMATDLTFVPRLPCTRLELLDSADDLGYLKIEGDRLRFVGDRVRFEVHREDVESVGRGTLAMGAHPSTELVLATPLGGRGRLRLNARNRVAGVLSGAVTGIRLRRRLRDWWLGAR